MRSALSHPRSWIRAIGFVAISPALTAHAEVSFHDLLTQYKTATQLPLTIDVRSEEDVLVSFTQGVQRTDREQFVYRSLFRRSPDQVYAQREIATLDPAGLRVRGQLARAVVTADRAVNYQLDAGGTAGMAWTLADFAHARERATWIGLMTGRALEGYLTGNGYANDIASLMHSGWNQTVASENDPASGKVFILSADTKFGRHVLRMSSSYLPLTIEVRKSGEDLLYDAPLSVSGVREYRVVVDSIETREVDSHMLGVAVRVRETTTYANGDVKEISTICRRTAIDVRPVFGPESFSIGIPDGTPVSVEPASGLQHEWRAGAIVPAVDTAMVASVEDAVGKIDPFPRRRISRWDTADIIVGIISIASIVAGLIIFLRMRAAKN